MIAEIAPEFETLEEGCLSVPKIELPVERSTKIKVKAQNQQGKKIRLTAKGLLARVLQHEIDHLNGILFTDRAKNNLAKKYPGFKKLKIVFLGSGDFAHLILEGLILLNFNLKQIITEKGKPAGRTQEIKPTPVAQMAEKFGKEYLEISNFGSESSSLKANRGERAHGQSELERLGPISSLGKSSPVSLMATGERQPDLIICTDFGKKIPEDILKIPKIAAINIHPSLLPKYRGPSPIQTAILDSGKVPTGGRDSDRTDVLSALRSEHRRSVGKTGVSIIKMVPKMDAGPILAQEKIEIWPEDNTRNLKIRLSNLALKMLLTNLPKLQSGDFQEQTQDESQASYTKKLKKEEGEIDWQKPAEEIDRQIRAYYPWPGTYTFVEGKRLIIHQSHLKNDKLVLDIVQREGKKPMTWSDFLRGFHGQKPKWFQKIAA